MNSKVVSKLAIQQPVIETWQKLLSEFHYSLDTFDTVVTTKLPQIALTAAKQVLGQSTVCDGTALLEEISHLLQQKPIFASQPELHVNPNHVALIEQHLGSLLNLNGWRLVVGQACIWVAAALLLKMVKLI